MQTGVTVGNGEVRGTLKYYDDEESALVTNWGKGNFFAFQIDPDSIPENATSCKVGLVPSEGSGLVEIIDDPDKNGTAKVTNKNKQVFTIETTVGGKKYTQRWELSDLVCKRK